MIPLDTHLLPLAETPLNKALAAGSLSYESMNAPAREVWDPFNCPPEFLEFLAHAFSVDIWDETWSDIKKRVVIARSIEMHREKGTEAGLRAYVGYTPGNIVSLITPPQRVYSGPSASKADREAWLASLPQVRVYYNYAQGNWSGKVFSGGPSAKMFVREGHFLPTQAVQELSRQASWVEDGVQTDEQVTDYYSYFQLHRRGNLGQGICCNDAMDGGFFIPTSAPSRIYTVAPQQAAPWKTTIRPSLVAVQSEPELIKDPGSCPASVFCGTPMGMDFFAKSTAWSRVYDRFPVDNGTRPVGRPSIQFMGLDRYGWPAHTARAKMSIPGTVSDLAAWNTLTPAAKKFWIPSDAAARIDKTCRGMIASKRASDVLQMQLSGQNTLIAGLDVLQAGTSTFIL